VGADNRIQILSVEVELRRTVLVSAGEEPRSGVRCQGGRRKLHGVKTIEVFADIWCPFAHLGIRRVIDRRVQLKREDVVLYVRAWPLELVNKAPLDPETTARHVHELRTQVAPELFRGFDQSHSPSTTLPALALAHAAYETDMRCGEAVSLALRNALFENGIDISHPASLSDIARSEGVEWLDVGDKKAVLADWQEGSTRGVKGSPHFFCGDADAFCPSLDISKDATGRLEVIPNLAVLDGFLESCFNG
jgi:predicted DsbA family dithiol-disulfide isomerase